MQLGVAIQHPGHHRMGHHRKTRHEMHMADEEAGDLVVRVGDDARAFGEDAHLEAAQAVGLVGRDGLALLCRHLLDALPDQLTGFGVERQRPAERGRGGLAGVVIGRRADAATAHDEVAAGKRLAQPRGQQLTVVAEVLGPGQLHAALAEQLDEFGEVGVLPLAGQDLVADDEQANLHAFKPPRPRRTRPPVRPRAVPARRPSRSGRTRRSRTRTRVCRARSTPAPGRAPAPSPSR
mmetsp:Transcript_36595/g.84871  ORF Transcript_36595/g.84871 Transcript_36595/m.84871 type:complete len:236 (-) Transcript_36595:3560-4267(-)